MLLVTLLVTGIASYAQDGITKDSVIGTWEYLDNDSQLQQLIVTQDSVTVIARVPVYGEPGKWRTISYSGPYTMSDSSTLHVIYHDVPREESFYHITRLANGEMYVVLNDTARHKRGKRLVYNRKRSGGVRLIPH